MPLVGLAVSNSSILFLLIMSFVSTLATFSWSYKFTKILAKATFAVWLFSFKHVNICYMCVFNRPGVAGAVL